MGFYTVFISVHPVFTPGLQRIFYLFPVPFYPKKGWKMSVKTIKERCHAC
ncbi:hypothetical protein LHK_01571 [Laribacter hongkongensis HLHK9]|uniref:Uncharacterized protein n=2 Tax=Laribacter hongkongensis TaxID=168471 RepID=C1D7W9_LARHH|nr:hypothetical protein LHK_01571 [Laribacter hongkongensis HLHK9]ASJ24772.1 hypothetical protein LHGZ1_1941 [Laribacter hongkongensis]